MHCFAIALAAGCLAVGFTAANSLQLPLVDRILDCSAWPTQRDKLAPPNEEFTKEYDLTGIPDTPLNDYPPGVDTGEIDVEEIHKKSQKPGYMNTESGTSIGGYARFQCDEPRQWAVTYDDGPSKYTTDVLNSLKQRNDTKAMFFVVGGQVCAYPQILVDAVNAGHEIGVHTWSHKRLSSLTNEEIIAEIKYTELAIVTLTGVKPKYLRPPYGNLDDRVKFIVEKMGYTAVNWNHDTSDWKFNYVEYSEKTHKRASKKIVGGITKRAQGPKSPGVISLEHDIAKVPTSVAGEVLDEISRGNWNLVPVTQCLGSSSWYQDDNSTDRTPKTDAVVASPPAEANSDAASSLSEGSDAAETPQLDEAKGPNPEAAVTPQAAEAKPDSGAASFSSGGFVAVVIGSAVLAAIII